MSLRRGVIAVFTLFFAFSHLGILRAGEKETRVSVVEIRGHKRIEEGTIRSRIKTKEGDIFSRDVLRDDLRSLYEAGFFDDIQIETEDAEKGIRVIFIVTEKPFLSEIRFEGNNQITTEKLKEKTTVKAQTFLDHQQMVESVEKMRKIYQEEGFYNIRIVPLLKVLPEGPTSLTFLVEEGEKTLVRKIAIEGNKAYSDRAIKKVLTTKEYFWLTSWMTQAGVYPKEDVQRDAERIRDFYHDRGYLQVQADAPQVSIKGKKERPPPVSPLPPLEPEAVPTEKKWFFITFRVREGEQFRIGKIELTGNTLFSAEDLRSGVKTKGGDIYNRSLLREDISSIADRYGEKGYAFVSIIPQLAPDAQNRLVDVVFDIREGQMATVRQINIFGNDKTRDKVIRREIRIAEQEPLNTKALRRSFQRLNNLNFFENIEIVPQEVGENLVDLDVRVKEKLTGTFSIGAGFSSADQFVGLLEVTQGNLFGRGQLLRARGELGKRRTTYSLTFREPYLFDRPVSGTVDLFDQVRNFDSYKEERRGGDLTLGKSFGEDYSGSLSYGFQEVNVFDLIANAPLIVQNQKGRRTTSSISSSMARDTRDFFLDPKEGSRHSLALELAGTVLGGDNDFFKMIWDSKKFFPLWLGTVFSLHAQAGYAHGIGGKPLPLGERFFVGGINTVRGFRFGQAGPLDPTTFVILGGNKEIIFNAEYLIPLVPEARIKGLVFFDAGEAANEGHGYSLHELRSSAGWGLRWISPIGPLRLEWGRNLNPRRGERTSTIEFTVGTLF